jgi:REP element-mobilizing transposase RayT
VSRWKIIEGINIYYVTTTIVEWQYVFVNIPLFETLIESLKYCIATKGLHLHGYVLMPTHAHYLVSAEPATHLSDILRDYQRFTSHRITELLEASNQKELLLMFRTAAEQDRRGNTYRVWQEGFHPVAIETEKFFQEKLEYIHQNPVRKGFVEQPEQWKYSSARNYLLDDVSIIHIERLYSLVVSG